MKVTQNIIRSDLRGMATSGSNSIDFRIPDTQLDYWTDQCRATLIAQKIQKREDITSVWVQTISCLELEQLDGSECCDSTTDCMVLRTVLKIPRTIETNDENSIIKVTDLKGNIISRVTENEAKYNSYNKYTSNKAKWYEKGGYIYIINNTFLSKINVDGLWESPSELTSFTGCDGETCFSPDDDYPCSNKMASVITDIVYKTKILAYMQLPQDNTNDASNDLPQQPR